MEDRIDVADTRGRLAIREVRLDDCEARLAPWPRAQSMGPFVHEHASLGAFAQRVERVAAVDVPDAAEIGERCERQELGRIVDQLQLRWMEVRERVWPAKASASRVCDLLSEPRAHRRRPYAIKWSESEGRRSARRSSA